MRIYTWILILVLISPSMVLSPSSIQAKLNSQSITQDKNQEWIAYVGVDKQLYVIHPDGSGKKQVSPGANLKLSFGKLSWSRSGRYLLFASDYDPSSHLWLWDSKTDKAKPILSTNFSNVKWSPTADILAVFETIPGDRVAYPLYTYNPETLELEKILENNGFPEISWLQDGTKIVYQPVSDGTIAECPNLSTWTDPKGIEIIDIETKAIDTIVPSKGRPLLFDSISPDGSIVYFREAPKCTSMGMAPGPLSVSVSNHKKNWIQSPYQSCESSNDNNFQACSTWSEFPWEVRVFDKKFEQIYAFNQKSQYLEEINYMTFSWSPNNELIAIIQLDYVSRPGEILSEAVYSSQFINIKTGELLSEIPGEFLAWSPDAKNVILRDGSKHDGYNFFVFHLDSRLTSILDSAPDDLMYFGYPAWQSRGLLKAPANVSIRPDAGKQAYIIEWDALNDTNVTYEVRYTFQEITESTWNGKGSYELHGDAQVENSRIKLPVTIDNSNDGQSTAKIFIGVRAVNENGVYSPISNTPWIVDWGFRPDVNGYNFSNSKEGIWKNDTGEPTNDFTKEDMVFMFGENAVCVQDDEPGCDLTFKADTALDNWTKQLVPGRCYGMAVTSGKYFMEDTSLFEGVPSTSRLYNDLNLEMARRRIAYYHVQQFTNPVTDRLINDKSLTLQDEMDQLTSLLENGEGAVIVIYNPDGKGGHAVTPIAIEQESNNLYRIWVYDNNHPSFTESPSIRSIAVNVSNQFWAYVLQEQEPNLRELILNEKPKLPEKYLYGIESSFFFVVPLDLHSLHPEMYRTGANDNPPRYVIQAPVGEGAIHLTIVDEAGHIIGYNQDTFVNQIEGADLQPVFTTLDSWVEPIYWLPAGSTYTVKISPISSEPVKDTLLSWIGDHFTIMTSRDTLAKAEELIVKDSGKGLVYHFNDTGPVSLSFSQTETDYETRIELQQYAFQAGDQLQILYDANQGDYRITYSGKEKISGNLTITLHDDQGERVIEKEDFQLQPENTHHVQIGSWSDDGMVRLGVDQNGDGQVDQWETERKLQDLLSKYKGFLLGGVFCLSGGFAVLIGLILLIKTEHARRRP